MLKINLFPQISKFLFFLIFFVCLLAPWLKPILAKEMESAQYQLKMDKINVTSGQKPKSGEILGQESEIKPVLSSIFSFSISDLTIDFSDLKPGKILTQSRGLTISPNGLGYQLMVFENHPLKAIGGLTQIPDTTCDGQENTCDERMAKLWTSKEKYGFGFNLEGDDVVKDFIDHRYYRQLADEVSGDSPQIIMSSFNIKSPRQAMINYQLNLSEIQATGNYENIITFICSPTY